MTATTTDIRDEMQKTLDGALGSPALLRRFVSHNDWHVPVEISPDGNRHTLFVKDSANQRFLLFFTEERSYQAGAAVIGRELIGESLMHLSGVDAFASVSDDADIVAINWGAPPEIFFKRAQFASLRRWSRAVR
ncbi:MAG TPA: hypothetical protein VGK87_08765, partial [Anaerolineae bacterium]